ncbi:MAG: hypothetical protein WAP08_11330, partial [Smithellaceae bacterium]|nr:hypothetical protein [Syntrophaceae bacterium]
SLCRKVFLPAWFVIIFLLHPSFPFICNTSFYKAVSYPSTSSGQALRQIPLIPFNKLRAGPSTGSGRAVFCWLFMPSFYWRFMLGLSKRPLAFGR